MADEDKGTDPQDPMQLLKDLGLDPNTVVNLVAQIASQVVDKKLEQRDAILDQKIRSVIEQEGARIAKTIADQIKANVAPPQGAQPNGQGAMSDDQGKVLTSFLLGLIKPQGGAAMSNTQQSIAELETTLGALGRAMNSFMTPMANIWNMAQSNLMQQWTTRYRVGLDPLPADAPGAAAANGHPMAKDHAAQVAHRIKLSP